MNFVSARRKKGKVKYTKILKKGALGEFKLGYKFAYISNGLSKETNILKICVHIYFDLCNCNYFSIFEAHSEGRAQSKPLNSLYLVKAA